LLFKVGCNKIIFIKLLALSFQSFIAVLGGSLRTIPLVRQAMLDASFRVKVSVGQLLNEEPGAVLIHQLTDLKRTGSRIQ